MDKTYGSYDNLAAELNGKGFNVSRTALWRFSQKIIAQSELARVVGSNLDIGKEERLTQMRLRCLELARGDTPEKRIQIADQYLKWVLKNPT